MVTHLSNTSLAIDKHKIGYGHPSMVTHLNNTSISIDKHKIGYDHPSKQYFTHH
jgi:hypothetical protein